MNTGHLTFYAKLLKAPPSAPRCGDIKVAVGLRVDVQEVLEGTLAKGPITLLVPCPDLMGDGFLVAGARYRVEAATALENAGSYTVYNDENDGPLLWAVAVVKT